MAERTDKNDLQHCFQQWKIHIKQYIIRGEEYVKQDESKVIRLYS